MSVPENFRSALPYFENSLTSSPSTNLRGTRQALSIPLSDASYFFPPNLDITDGLALDTTIERLRTDMLSLRCFKCNHVSCHKPPENSTAYLALRRDPRLRQENAVKWSPNGLLIIEGRIYAPDYKDVRLRILKARHDSILAGHPGISKTTELVQRDYIWFGINAFVSDYVRSCDVCSRNKTNRSRPYGHLHSLPVPKLPFTDLTMDFIEKLPESNSFNSILVVVDRLTKYSIFIPTTVSLTSDGLVDLFVQHIFSRHGLPKSIVSDRGAKFTSIFWRSLMKRLGVKLNLSTAYHPQTDGQTERVNQNLEHYLRNYVNFDQDDWSTYLPLAQFCLNNHTHSTLTITPFFALHGYQATWIDEFSRSTSIQSIDAEHRAESMQEIHNFCAEQIAKVNEYSAKYYNANHRTAPAFQPGDKVLLSLENIRTIRPTRKFDHKRAGPFTVVEAIGSHAYRLNLPASMKVHNVFHVSLLESYNPPFIQGRKVVPPPPIIVNNEREYEVQAIVNSRYIRNSKRKVEYLVEWRGYEGTEEEMAWEPAPNLRNAKDLVLDYHERRPDKPKDEIFNNKHSKRNRQE